MTDRLEELRDYYDNTDTGEEIAEAEWDDHEPGWGDVDIHASMREYREYCYDTGRFVQ